ncbi:MAG: hypothetical protein WBW84_13590 [Acidobacteriaceae bacterium]
MAVVQISDVIVPEFYAPYGGFDSMSSTALFQSGILQRNPILDTIVAGPGQIANVPMWGDLAAAIDSGGSEPNIGTDNPSDVATTKKISAVNMLCRNSFLNDSWSAADLATELAGSDPMQRVAERLQAYWVRQYEYRLSKSLYGILLSNVANDSGDMTMDVSSATTEAPVVINGESYTSPNLSRDVVIDTVASAGDRLLDFKCIAMHSSVYRNLAKLDAITFIRTSDQGFDIPTAFGMAVAVDDNLALSGGAYLSVVFRAGAVGFAEGPGRIPIEFFRWPQQGNGAGVEELHSRRNSIIAVNGFSFTSSSVASDSPDGAELATAANWSRVVPRKNVPLAFIITMG